MKKHVIPIIIIAIVTLAFFAKLFFPEPKIFFTPEMGTSDIWNFNYPLKDLLATSLKKGQFSFWNKNIGTGFPVFDEGQIGTLFIPNIILFSLLPTWIAFNTIYILSFFTTMLGTYTLLIKNKKTPLTSLYAALTFGLSGFFISHINHITYIQAASLIPWLFLLGQAVWEKPTKSNILIFAILLAQSVFVGSQPITFIGLVGLSLYVISQNIFVKRKQNFDSTIKFFLSILLGFILAAPQLIPTLQLNMLSIRRFGMPIDLIFKFHYPIKYLITFLFPTFFGTPKDGSYPAPNENWGIFWENTFYLGVITILLLILTLIRKRKHSWEKSFIIIAIVSSLLAIGKKSLLIFLLPIPGFSFFRLPSRFLLLTSFAVSLLAASGLEMLTKKLRKTQTNNLVIYSFITIIISLNTIDLFHFGFTYHPLISVKEFLQPPESLNYIKDSERIYTHTPNQVQTWNNVFFSQGWKKIEPYIFFKNALEANFSLIFNQPHISVTAGLSPIRNHILHNTTNFNMLSAQSAKYIISPEPVNLKSLSLITTISSSDEKLNKYYVYQNQNSLERFRFATQYKVVEDINKAIQITENKEFSFKNTAILEIDPQITFHELETADIQVLKDQNQHLSLKTTTDKQALFIIADSYYPNWFATINGKKTKIYPANINQRALIIPPGENHIELKYIPFAFYLGSLLSFSTLSGFGLYFYKQRSLKKPSPNNRHKTKKTTSV